MKISVDGEFLFEVSPIQKRVLKNSIKSDLDEQLKGLLIYILMNKFQWCMARMRRKWDTKLAARYKEVPADDERYAELVFSQPDYEDSQTRLNKRREDDRRRIEAHIKKR